MKNLDSKIGIYAGSADSYTKFEDLFNRIIVDYHKGFNVETGHRSDMDASGLQNLELTAEEQEMIVSTRIRVGRNLKGYPLGPGVTKQQRLDIMNKVIAAAKTFDDDLTGKFYPLEGMNEATRK